MSGAARKLLVVKWMDHHSLSRWHDIDDGPDRKPLHVESVGWVTYEDDDYIWLSNSLTDHKVPDAIYTQAIMKCAIKDAFEVVF